jgi:4-hydroxybenzoate polyprenyltransferase
LIGACFLDGVTAALVLVAMLLLALYSAILSRLPLIGNVVIGVLAVMSIASGSVVVSGKVHTGESGLLFLAAGLAFFVHLSRECIKSAEDIDGDRVQGRNTVATIFGRNATVLLSVPILLLGVWLSCEFVHLTWEGGALSLSLIYFPAAVISCVILWLVFRSAEMNLRLASLGLKIYLAYGLILILLMDFAQVPVFVVLP